MKWECLEENVYRLENLIRNRVHRYGSD